MPPRYFLPALVVALCWGAVRPAAAAEEPLTLLSGQVELPRLVDLCAERLKLNIEYDAAALRGTVTLRLGAGVSDEELWALTNRVLASRGFASVQMPGEDVLSIVRLADAPAMARLELPDRSEPAAGYVTAIARVEHQPIRDLVSAVELVLSRTGSAATRIGETNLLLLSDLKPRIKEALRLLEMLDVPTAPPSIAVIPSRHLPASQLASLVTAAGAARDGITGRPMRGKLTPLPDGHGIVLVAPPAELAFWERLVLQFDQREEVQRRTYSPRHFGLGEVGRLIEEAARVEGARGSGDRWRMVSDELTGTIIVTATEGEHSQIESLLQRLAAVPAEERRPVRAFPVRNRSVHELTDVLARLIDAGMLEAAELSSRVGSEPDPATNDRSNDDAGDAPSHTNRTPAERHPRLILTADEGTSTLIATGAPRQLSQLEDLIRRLDVRQSQVMIEVLVVSLSESDALDLGVELRKLEITDNTLISLTSLFGLTPAANLTTLPTPGQGFTGVVLSPGDFSVVLRALQNISRGRSLSMPKVLVNNNQAATLDSVLEQPFSTLVSIDQVTTTTLGGTLDAGTVVTIRPQIAEGDHLVLEYSVSLSSFVGESPDPLLPPPRQQNKLQSVVTIPDGHTVVVGGLELTSESIGVSQIPLVGDIPLIGEAFKSRSRSKSRSRFFVFIRSNILRHRGSEDLKYLSDRDAQAANAEEIMRDFPRVQPRVIR